LENSVNPNRRSPLHKKTNNFNKREGKLALFPCLSNAEKEFKPPGEKRKIGEKEEKTTTGKVREKTRGYL